MTDRRDSGFKDRTRLDAAVDRLRAATDSLDRTERVPVTGAVGRVLAEDVTAHRPLPRHDRAATDGYAVVSEDTFGAGGRSPAVLRPDEPGGGDGSNGNDDPAVSPGTTRRVEAGDRLPSGADAVVRIEDADRYGSDLEVGAAVATGANVTSAGADVREGATVFEAGRRIRESDLALCTSLGRSRLEVFARPTVGVVPTGDELVDADPGSGETVETNGLVAATFAERWGGKPNYRNVVDDDRHALRAAIERDLTKDVLVTTGGTGVGETDLVPDVVADLGEVHVHGVAVEPGGSAGIGVVRETPVVMLPGDPVACLVAADRFVRPAVRTAGGLPRRSHPSVAATLAEKISSTVGVRTFARVTLDEGEATAVESVESSDSLDREARPVSSGGAGVLSSVATADGWVVVPESREGVPAGETVTVEDWEYQP
ncbi:molybdopterin molybdenumtransferase MoeA [Halobacteriales archaeon QH_8_68_33]|nr:MAG: molybdopterin molybdenumtransferase MoeA [Halobacteriales archaeon QH_8_68_33]